MLGVGAYMIVHGIGQPEGQTNIIFGVVVIALFVVINPLMIYAKAKKQAIEISIQESTYYTLRDDGIFVELGEESATIEWARVYKITHFMGLTLLYTGKQQAFVFPDYELWRTCREKDVRLYERTHQRSKKEGCSDTDRWRRYFKNIPRHLQKLSRGRDRSIGNSEVQRGKSEGEE